MSSKAQRRVLIGKESTPGDGATVDVALRAVGNLKAVVDKKVPAEDIGSFSEHRHFIGSKHAEGSLEFDAYYEHLPYPISMALGDGAVVTSGDPEIWTFAWPGTAADTFATYNMEVTDGNNHIVKAVDVFATGLEIKGEAGGSWMITPTLVGSNVTYPSAVGASPTLPAGVRPVLMADTALWMTNSFGDLGSLGLVTGALISFSWKLENFQHQKLFAGSLYPTGRGNDKWKITLELILEMDNATVESIKDRLLTVQTTAVGIRALADEAGGTGIDWYINIDGVYFVQDVSELDDREGNNTIKFVLSAEADTSGNTGEIEIGTSLTAL